jgi:hypothetical protein
MEVWAESEPACSDLQSDAEGARRLTAARWAAAALSEIIMLGRAFD